MNNSNRLWLSDKKTAKSCQKWQDIQSRFRDGENVAWKRQKMTDNGQEIFQTVVGKITEKTFLIFRWEKLEWIPVEVHEVYDGIVVENGQAFKMYRRIGIDQAGNEYQLTSSMVTNLFQTAQGWVDIVKEEDREIPAMECARIINTIGWDVEGNEYLVNQRIWGKNCGQEVT